VVDPILNVWVTFALMVTLWVLAIKKHNGGLWTTDPNATSQVVQPTYIVYQQPPPMQQEWRQPQVAPQPYPQQQQAIYAYPQPQQPYYQGQAVPLQEVRGHTDVKTPPNQ
jgi:hypothetical protein